MMSTYKRRNVSKKSMAAVKDEWGFRLTLVRHGETNQNRNKIIQGQDNTVLNDTGREQVELVGNRFKYEHLTRIYSSDLQRAEKTAEGICLRNVHLKDLKICSDPLLRERNYGEAEGKSRLELKKMLHAGKLPLGAETDSEVQKRAVDFFTSLLKDVNHLRKTHHSKTKVDPCENDLSSEEEHLHKSIHLKSDSVVTTNRDHLNESHQSKLRATSLPAKFMTNGGSKFHPRAPVLLKDLRWDPDDSTECDHTERPIHIVLVSHGGIIRHFVYYFSKQFPSQFPVDKRKLLRQICPNTGVSDFAVFLEGRKVVNIDCLQLYDKTHLT